MIEKVRSASLALVAIALAGCSTTAQFRLPAGTEVRLDRRPVTHAAGQVTSSPYFWTNAGGIPYAIEKDGKPTQQGKVPAGFRPVSIFWPPAALIYWPMGFGWDCYDLTGPEPRQC